jgi:tyrosyl-tRNA synthetase
VETAAELRARVRRGTPLRVKFGVDPTGSELHLGHAVVLHKMQQFVAAGHDVTLLIGDFTALIGDPSGRNESRPHLTPQAIAENMRTYTEQAGTILDLERVQVRYNSEWLAKLDLADLIRLLSQTTVAQMLSREDFRTRYVSETPIALHEFLYPVAQAYDSVALACDVELGGDDQLFNFLLARTYQTAAGQPPQICMTLPILEGTDGKVRMGKSRGNYVGLSEPAREQFGKTMSIPDALIARWARLADFRSETDCAALEHGIRAGTLSPLEEKKKLACAIVKRYHGADAAHGELTYWDEKYNMKVVPQDIAVRTISRASVSSTVAANGSPAQESASGQHSGRKLIDIMVDEGFADSKRAARSLIAQRAVELDDVVVDDPNFSWPDGLRAAVLRVGKRLLVKLEVTETLPPTVDHAETIVTPAKTIVTSDVTPQGG